MAGRLDGKSALVLGAASQGNMAQVTAKLFASEGAKVIVAGRKEEELKRFASEIGGEYTLCDITIHDQVTAMVKNMSALEISAIDLGVMMGVILLIAPMMLSRMKLSKVEGGILLGIYFSYIIVRFMLDKGMLGA